MKNHKKREYHYKVGDIIKITVSGKYPQFYEIDPDETEGGKSADP